MRINREQLVNQFEEIMADELEKVWHITPSSTAALYSSLLSHFVVVFASEEFMRAQFSNINWSGIHDSATIRHMRTAFLRSTEGLDAFVQLLPDDPGKLIDCMTCFEYFLSREDISEEFKTELTLKGLI